MISNCFVRDKNIQIIIMRRNEDKDGNFYEGQILTLSANSLGRGNSFGWIDEKAQPSEDTDLYGTIEEAERVCKTTFYAKDDTVSIWNRFRPGTYYWKLGFRDISTGVIKWRQ